MEVRQRGRGRNDNKTIKSSITDGLAETEIMERGRRETTSSWRWKQQSDGGMQRKEEKKMERCTDAPCGGRMGNG